MKYINAERILDHTQPVIQFLASGRGTGKTVNILHALTAECFKNGTEFIYLDLTDELANTLARRLGIMNGVNNVDWSQSSNHPDFTETVYYFNRDFFVIEKYDTDKTMGQNVRDNGQCVGHYQILENRIDYKSIEFPQVDYIFIDEFSDKIKKFANFFYELSHHVSTVFRERQKGQVILLGNAADAKNPLLNLLEIGGPILKRYIDKKPYYNGMIYCEFFTVKSLIDERFENEHPFQPTEYPTNARDEKMSFAEKLAYALKIDLDSVDLVDDSSFISDNINNEKRQHVDLLVTGKGENLSFTRLSKTLLVQSSKPLSYNKKINMDSTLNRGFENEWLDYYLNYPMPKLFEDAQAKIKFTKLGGR